MSITPANHAALYHTSVLENTSHDAAKGLTTPLPSLPSLPSLLPSIGSETLQTLNFPAKTLPAKITASSTNKAIRFAGYAAIFDRVDSGGDIVRRGAFTRWLSKTTGKTIAIPLLWQHQPSAVIGAIKRLQEDTRGLRIVGHIHDSAIVAQRVASGTLTGLSFGYRVRRARGETHGAGKTKVIRELLDLDLAEISLVERPMQPLARIIVVQAVARTNKP